MTMNNLLQKGLMKKRSAEIKQCFKECIGNHGRSWYRQKDLPVMQGAILDTLYDAGKGATLRPVDMLNSNTRLAWLVDNNIVKYQSLPKRGSESCGHDEYNGASYTMYECSLRIDWTGRARVTQDGVNSYYRVVDREQTEAKRKEWVDRSWEELKSKYTLAKIHEGADLTEEQQNENTKHHFVSKDSNPVIHYDVFNTSNYKGECAWKDTDRYCDFHQQTRHEAVLVYYTKGECRYIDELTDLPQWLRDNTDDDKVLALIKKTIPKMKTEARSWLESTYEGSELVTDSEGNKKWVTTRHGKRGQYSLTWWNHIERRLSQNAQRATDKGREGTELNGWLFTCGRNGDNGEWETIDSLYKYYVGGTRGTTWNKPKGALVFNSKAHAEQAVDIISKIPGRIIAHNESSDLLIDKRKVRIRLSNKGDPLKYTPKQAWDLICSGKIVDDIGGY